MRKKEKLISCETRKGRQKRGREKNGIKSKSITETNEHERK
jgi:hypothetical protein